MHRKALAVPQSQSRSRSRSPSHSQSHRKALAVLRLVGDVDEEGDARRVAREERRDERHVQVHAFQNERLVRQLERGDEALNMAREQLRASRCARAVVSTGMPSRSSVAINVPAIARGTLGGRAGGGRTRYAGPPSSWPSGCRRRSGRRCCCCRPRCQRVGAVLGCRRYWRLGWLVGKWPVGKWPVGKWPVGDLPW